MHRKCARRNCAEIVHTKMCRKCAHKNVQKLCTQKCAENVHTQNVQNCARRVLRRFVMRKFSPMCAQSCVRELCRRKISGDAHQKVLCAWTFCVMCAKVFGDDLRKLSENVHVQNCAQTVTCAKCQKWPKNDQKWPKLTIWPKWPKMAQNGPKWQKMSRVGTWLVTGPLRLVTQGGKSCQNMH